MATKARKARSDSLEHHLKLVDKHGDKIVSPLPLEGEEPVIFEEIIGALPSEQWDAYRIRLAAHLAQYLAYMDKLMVDLKSEGPTVLNKRGTPVANPNVSVTQSITGTVERMTRTLGLSASQRGVTEGTKKKQGDAEAKVRRGKKAADKNALIA